MFEQNKCDRRGFLSSAAMTIAAVQLAVIGSAKAEPGQTGPSNGSSFGKLKQIDAGVLNIGYAETGASADRAVILLHGWPYDIYSFIDVAPILASAGYRVIIPFLRGFGTTRFLSNETFRNGQPSALALDIIAFMDALKIQKAILAGFDWGARTANIIAALWPSSSIIIDGGCRSLKVSRNMTIWKNGLPRLQSSLSPRSRWKAMQMARRILSPVPMRRNFRENIPTGISREASVTIYPRKTRALFQTPYSK